jgi:hypothetical protein
MDYEHQPANHLCFRLARKVIVPEYFPGWALRKFGVKPKKTAYYHGTKEQIYLADFVPQPDYLTSLGLPVDKTIVVMRPPGSWALYHHFENPLFEQVLDYVVKKPEAYVVFLPRIPSQGDAVHSRGYANVWIPPTALDGPNLLYHADLVISGGGTMNREASVLGTPTYSLFKGKLAGVDHYLIEQGYMKHIGEENKIPTIEVSKKKYQKPLTNGSLLEEITEAILDHNNTKNIFQQGKQNNQKRQECKNI